jgi:SHS2 domain-containing protein
MLGKYWEHFTHDEGKGVRGIGASADEAFEQVAIGISALITMPHDVTPLEEVSGDCEAQDYQHLLTEWVNWLIQTMDERRMLFSRFDAFFDGPCLHFKAWGEGFDAARHTPAVKIKELIDSESKVLRDETGSWLAQCVVRI